MSRLQGLDVLIAGAGAVGSVLAFRLLEEGASVRLHDPAALGDNASGVAAGMLAPAFEAALDPAARGHLPLFRHARDLWPALVARLEGGAALERSGAVWAGDVASLDRVLGLLANAGADAETIDEGRALRLLPGLRAPEGALFTAEDWRLDARAMLDALHRGIERRGGRIQREPLRDLAGAQAVVLATGLAPEGLAEAPAEIGRLSPIKGQIVRLPGTAPLAGPMLRLSGAYVVPNPGGALVGATMEPGLDDRAVDPAALEGLRRAAASRLPVLASAPMRGAAGVRAATPDGLPMAGASSRAGVWLALGARRNGWLLAPLMAAVVADALAGAPPGPWAGALDPLRRFS